MDISEIIAKMPADVYDLDKDATHLIVVDAGQVSRQAIRIATDSLKDFGIKCVILMVDDAKSAVKILEFDKKPTDDPESDEEVSDVRPYPGKPSPRELMNMGFDIGAEHSRQVVDKLKDKMDDASKKILGQLEKKIHEIQQAQQENK